MELDEMKAIWGKMSVDIEQQKRITELMIAKVTESGYKSAINRVHIPEMAGATICLTCFFYIATKINLLTTWYLMACGIVAMAILLAMPVLSLLAIKKFKAISLANNNSKQLLVLFAVAKKRFLATQKLSLYLGPLLFIAVLPVLVRLMGGNDFFKIANVWLVYVLFWPFFYPFAKWVFKGYKNLLKQGNFCCKNWKTNDTRQTRKWCAACKSSNILTGFMRKHRFMSDAKKHQNFTLKPLHY